MTDIAVMAIILVGVSLLRVRLSSWPITGPMLFVGAGLLLGPDGLGVLTVGLEDESVVLAAEVTLAMLLFSDATRINTGALIRSVGLPARLLGIGLPLSIGVGTLVTALFLTDLSWAEAALVAAVLAPTDAALGQAVVSDRRVPVRVRQALNVESGLNDGLVVPVIAVFALLASGVELDGPGSLLVEAFTEVAIGLVIGVGAGLGSGLLLPWASKQNWTNTEGVRLATYGGALAGFAGASALGGNGFIAAFVCGIALHLVLGEEAGKYADLTEDIGQVGAAATFVIFGALMVWPALRAVDLALAVCAVATLTVGRIMPVHVAMAGTGLKAPTITFLGWFGPRGLASMLFGLLIVAERGSEADQLFSIITLVIFTSVILHGVTAAPGATLYARWYSQHGHPEMAESYVVPESRLRGAKARSVD